MGECIVEVWDLETLLVVQGRDLDTGDASVAPDGFVTALGVVEQDVEVMSAKERVTDRLVGVCLRVIVVFENRQEDFDGF